MLIEKGSLLIDGFILFILCIYFIQLIKRYSFKLGLIDIPNDRSSHTDPTPRGAGIAIFGSFYLVTAIFHFSFFVHNLPFFVSLAIVFILGVYDDLRDSSAKLKLLLISLAAAIAFIYGGFEIKTFGNWFGYDLSFPYIVSLIFTMFAIAGFTNALNLIDGLDGLAATLSFIIISSLFYIGYIYNDQFIVIVSFFVLMSLIAFLFFNWHPASIFMGDSGSLALGFVISILAVRATTYISDTAILFIAAIPIIDTIIVMTRRLQRGISPFSPDKTHIHHKMLNLKKSVDGSVHIIVALQIILSAVGILLRDKSDFTNLILFLIILFIFFQALDSRKEQRTLLFFTKLKSFYIEKIRKKFKCNTIYITFTILIIFILLRIFS